MQDDLSFDVMQPGDEDSVCELVHRVFMKYVSPYYGEDGTREFMDYAAPEKLADRSKKDHFVLTATSGGRTEGMIEIRENNHVSLFFVERHGSGTGRELLRRAIDRCRRDNPGLKSITVHSSPNAVSVYERLGFSATGPLQIVKGIVFIPMMLDIGDAEK